MDAITRSHVIQGLRSGPGLDKHAASLCELLTSTPVELHEMEANFQVAKEGDFNFLISAHHREVRAVYSHLFVSGQPGRLRGRYQFHLLPMAHEVFDSTPPSLLTFLINSGGDFTIGGVELYCDPPAFQRSLMRNVVLTYAIASLHQALTVQVT
jgi:hypothetical protein